MGRYKSVQQLLGYIRALKLAHEFSLEINIGIQNQNRNGHYSTNDSFNAFRNSYLCRNTSKGLTPSL